MAIEGTSGNDVLFINEPAAGDPTGSVIWAHEGDDIIVTSFTGAVVAGDEGNDSILLTSALSDWGLGGTGNDFILDVGGGDDFLSGDDGDDWLDGGDGVDDLRGGAGNDQMFGGFGKDYMKGDAGADWLWGQYGDDQLFGDDGDDVLFAGDGDDLLRGDAGVDVLSGDEGADNLSGGAGTDFLFGGAGDDWMDGDGDGDLLFGGDANDKVRGGAGQDQLWGGAGIDSFMVMTTAWSAPAAPNQTHAELGLFHIAAGQALATANILWDAYRHDVVADWSESDNDVIDILGLVPTLHMGTDLMGIQAVSDGAGGSYLCFLSGVDDMGTVGDTADDVSYYSVLAQLIGTETSAIDVFDFVL